MRVKPRMVVSWTGRSERIAGMLGFQWIRRELAARLKRGMLTKIERRGSQESLWSVDYEEG